MSENPELKRALAYEAIRERIPDIWTLLEIVESANPPKTVDDDSLIEVTMPARDGWSVTFYYDVCDLDYIDKIVSPEGIVIEPMELPMGAAGKNQLWNWREMGDLARLKKAALTTDPPVKLIDLRYWDDEIPINEDDFDDLWCSRACVIGGYVDWDSTRNAGLIRKLPEAGA